MDKYYGTIGFVETEETTPGVWNEQITERQYYGSILKKVSRRASADKLNDDIEISNMISIVADEFAYNKFYSMKYAELFGTLWKVTSVEVSSPRLTLTLGGVYNGPNKD